MISTLKTKKGVVLYELIAMLIIYAIIATMVSGLTFFVFKTFDYAGKESSKNAATIIISQGLTNDISDFGATNLDYANKTSTKVTLYRYKFFSTNASGVSIKHEYGKDDTPDSLIIELLTSGTNKGKIQVTLKPGHYKDGSTDSEAKAYTRVEDTNNFTFDLTKTFFEVTELTSTSTGEIKSYLLKMTLNTDLPYEREFIMSTPILVKVPE